ncbi:hypothetical protein O0L34_g4368 [Tuta absoluta]|nr:hypothetical protein O0L34_g4368 [Tuta absoluta]
MDNGPECPLTSIWNVPLVLDTEKKPNHKYAILVLNRPLTQNEKFLVDFWNNATVRLTVDGGTRQWDLYVDKLSTDKQKDIKQPDFITGDFDSITQDILQKYQAKGCEIIHTPDQDYTDFTKALIELKTFCQVKNIEINYVIAFGQSSGRLDQILGIIQTLFLVKEKHLLDEKMKVFLITDDAISWLLAPGKHWIDIPEETWSNQRAWCSLVPVGEACESVTTTGLKWNLVHQPLKFGDLVSTSNSFDCAAGEGVSIKCSHTLLWSMRVPAIAGRVPH